MSSEPIKMLSRWVHVRCTSNQMEMTASATDSLFCHEDTSSRKWATYLDDIRFCSCTWLSSSISISSSSMHRSGTCVRWWGSYWKCLPVGNQHKQSLPMLPECEEKPERRRLKMLRPHTWFTTIRNCTGHSEWGALGKMCLSLFLGFLVFLYPFFIGKRHKQFLSRDGVVCSYTTSLPLNSAVVYWVQVWERTPHNPLCHFHHPRAKPSPPALPPPLKDDDGGVPSTWIWSPQCPSWCCWCSGQGCYIFNISLIVYLSKIQHVCWGILIVETSAVPMTAVMHRVANQLSDSVAGFGVRSVEEKVSCQTPLPVQVELSSERTFSIPISFTALSTIPLTASSKQCRFNRRRSAREVSWMGKQDKISPPNSSEFYYIMGMKPFTGEHRLIAGFSLTFVAQTSH